MARARRCHVESRGAAQDGGPPGVPEAAVGGAAGGRRCCTADVAGGRCARTRQQTQASGARPLAVPYLCSPCHRFTPAAIPQCCMTSLHDASPCPTAPHQHTLQRTSPSVCLALPRSPSLALCLPRCLVAGVPRRVVAAGDTSRGHSSGAVRCCVDFRGVLPHTPHRLHGCWGAAAVLSPSRPGRQPPPLPRGSWLRALL